jgi:hypothetical protein
MKSPTTILGAVAAALIGLQIDFEKLGNGDRGEIAKIAFAVVIGALGYFGADRPQSAIGDVENKRETRGVVPGEDNKK